MLLKCSFAFLRAWRAVEKGFAGAKIQLDFMVLSSVFFDFLPRHEIPFSKKLLAGTDWFIVGFHGMSIFDTAGPNLSPAMVDCSGN